MFIEYRGKTPRVSASAFVAPTAVLVGDVVVEEDSSAAIANAVYHATGKRIRDLPITLDKLL